jgi:hypothetical protein
MATITNPQNSVPTVILLVVLLAAAFAGGYYYYQQKDKDTILDINVGGRNISAQIEHE